MGQRTLAPYPDSPDGSMTMAATSRSAAAVAPALARSATPRAVSTWCVSRAKRAFDLCLASFVVLVTLPLAVIIAALIKGTSPGPILFRQSRVGQNGRQFQLFKFRSMVNDCGGPRLTCHGDGRVTTIGRVLRKFKLDELPQFLNVLRGEMSVVGPRPHVPDLFQITQEHQATILKLRPGITGSATLLFRREEESLQSIPWQELRRYYITSILPEKIQIELDYAKTATFFTDTGLVIRTAGSMVLPSVGNGRRPRSLQNAGAGRGQAA